MMKNQLVGHHNNNINDDTSESSNRPMMIGVSVDEEYHFSFENNQQHIPTSNVDDLVDRFSSGGSCRSPGIVGEHENVQKKAFTKWLNSHLSKKNHPLIVDLYTDLRDGTILIALLDVLYECSIKLERGRLRVHHLNNVARVLQVLNERQVKLVNICTNDIVDGNAKLTLGLVWCIILHWQVNHILRHTTGKFSELLLVSDNGNGARQTTATESNRIVSNLSIPSRIPIVPVPSTSAKQSLINQTSAKGNLVQSSATMSANDLERTLLSWCQSSTANYEGVNIKNFTNSWVDGLAFNALIHHYRPNLFNYGQVLAMDSPQMRLQHAFDVASKHLNIEKLLDPEDLNTPRPDKKSVIVYVMCLFQKFNGSHSEQSTSKVASPSSKNHTKTQVQPSNIPILSSTYSQNKRSIPSPSSASKKSKSLEKSPKVHQSSSNNSSTVLIDPKLHEEYSNEIEEILIWIFSAEDKLSTAAESDSRRFESTTGDNGSSNLDQSITTELRHNRVMTTIEAAEYAKTRFELHEEYMRELAVYYGKITKTFEKGQLLLGSTDHFEQNNKNNKNRPKSQENELRKEIAIQMKLLDDRFNQLRDRANDLQMFLQQKLVEAQNSQLEELRRLMTQTEERIAVIIPERYNDMPSTPSVLDSQLIEFDQLQQAIIAEQNLLKLISKFVIIDAVDESGTSTLKETNFMDQLDALNERWANACQIIERRGLFLKELKQFWDDYCSEEQRLQEWFNRLERRLTGMEETIDEVDDQLIDSSSRQSIEQKKRFLEDILKRLDRMCVEIMVGIEHSQKMHALKYDEDKDEDEDEDDNENKTPLSKFNNVVRRLLGLGENGMCSNVQKSIVSISIRWETMIGRIDHAKSITNRRLDMLNQLIKQTPIEDSFHQSTKPNKTMADILTTFHDNKSLSKWINSIETIVNQLQIMENLKNNISSYSGEPLKTINEIESFEMKSFTNITECLTYYDELCQQRASIYPTFIIDDKQRLSSEIVQNELKQLSSMIEKLKKLEHDFTDIRKQSKMFINNLNNANEEIQLKSVLKEIEKRFNDLRPILKRCHQYIETLSELKSLEEKFFIIKRQLDLNYKKLMEIINIIDHDHSLVENIQEQIEQFTNSINEQQSTILHLNETIIRLQKNSPELFFCWPEDVKEWKRLKLNSHSKFCTFQLNCFQLSTEMKMNIDLFITLFNAEKLIGKHLDDIRKEIAEESKQKSMDDDDDGDGEPKSPTNKLQAAIDALKNWLLGVMQVVEVYEDDDDIDSDDQEPNDNNMDSITTATTTINNDDQMNRSIKVPGSRLRSFSDLANAIDNRIEVLMELHNTVSNEQCNYEFACRRTTELYFGISNSTDETDLNTIEHRLRDITETELGERSQSDRILIESIQQLIERWHHVSDQFNTLLEKLESISPSTMVLEAEYAGIARWIEDATTFLDEAITVGDLETLSEQLCECERLKEYMEQSVEKTFQPLLETAKEAVRVLFGTKNQLSVQVPIVSEIENVWNDLSERINHKLDRLRLAHELTRRLNQTLNEHQDWLRSFESEMNSPQYRDVNQAEFEQLFKEFMNSNVIDDDDECSRYNWRSAFPPMSMLDRLQSRRSSYLRTVLEPPDSLISQMLSFQTTGHSSLAFDKQKKHAKIELVRAFDSLETKLKCRIETIMGHVQNLIQFVRLIGEEMSLLERFQVVSDDVQEKMVSIETIEQSELLIHDLELMLSESVSSNRQNRLNSIQTLLASDSNLFQFLIDSGQQMIVEQQQQQVQHILTHDSRLRSTAEKNLDSLEQYCRQYKQYEERIQLIHQWLQDYRHDDPNALAAKRAELGRLETECDQVMSPKTSINRLVHCRIEFLRKIFNEFERQKVAPNEQPSPTTNEYVSRLEQELADLGTSINELEINFDDDELQALITSGADVETILQWLPSFLQRIIYEDCVRYEQRLQTFHRQLPNDGGQRTKRIDKLYETHGALTKALQYRKTLLIELIDLCNQINRKLVQLETEGSKILVNQQQQQQQQSPESIGNIKRKCILILNEICQLKEQLDIHCIRQSDVLIGIEEIGSKYDEIITEIAERYLDDVDEEEDDEGENGGNDESSVAVERIRPNLSNNVTGSAAKHLSTINEESGIVVPAQSQKMEQDSSNVEQHLSINNKQIEMVSMMQNNKNDDDELSYSIKPYLNELNQLERRIISICSVTTIECTNRPSSNKKLSISLVEDELHRLNKSLNEVRTPYESALCCAAIFGLINSSKRKSSKNLPDDGIEHESSIEETNDERSPTQSQQLISMLGTLQTEFGISWNRFLSLHRHWWLVRDATLQFNSEFRKLSDWFENVELQLINGRWTTIVIDDNEPYGCFNFDVTDLNLSIIARTQLLLITQLKSHIPIYGKIQVLYRRLSQCFTPDEPDPNGEDHIRSAEDRKALLDARGHIQKRMSTIDCRWMKIVRELTWRRECLLALASGKLVANVSGYPYRRGKDPDFDKVLDDFVRQQSDRPNEWFQLEQLRRWIDDTRNCLVHIRSEYIVSDMESSMKLYSRLNSLQVELSHHYLHWMAVTQQPFIDGRTTSSVLRYHLTDMNEIEELDRSFVQVTAHLYNMCYFTQMYMTCFAYVQQLTNSEIEWIVTAIEHLNMIEDYQKLDDNQTELEFPLESITFVESLKNTLITHENNIEQITTIVTELTQHANEMEIQLNLSEFMSEFDQLTLLRQHLTNRLRVSGQTVCAAFHHLLKQAHNRLYSLRNIRECINQQQQQHVQQQQQHHSHQQSPILSGNQTGSLRSHQSTHSRRTIDQNSLSINGHEAMNQRKLHLTIIDLRSYYETALPQFDRWLALECFIISYYCAQCFPIENQQHQQSNISTRTKSTNQPMKPSRLLKLTIRRIEDFLTEFNFAQIVLYQIWSELDRELHHPTGVNQISSSSLSSISTKSIANNNNNHGIDARMPKAESSQQTESTNQIVLSPPDHQHYERIKTEIMERIRDLQREHHKRSLQHLLQQQQQQQQQNVSSASAISTPSSTAISTMSTTVPKTSNLYDTVADAFQEIVGQHQQQQQQQQHHQSDDDEQQSRSSISTITPSPSYHRPSDLPEIGSSSANLNSQRTEIESWLMSVEKRFADFVQEYNHHSLLSTARRSSGDKRSSNGDLEASSNLCTKASLSKQLTIISNYQTELNQYSAKLSTLSNSIDARIASLAPKGSDISKSNISMPYYDHLIELRKHADEMQIRLNDLYLSMKCKLRSLQEIWNNCNNLTAGNGIHGGSSTTVGVNSNSSRFNLASSGIVNGGGLDLGIDFHNTSSLLKQSTSSSSSSPKSSKHQSSITSSSSSSQPLVQNAAIAAAARNAAVAAAAAAASSTSSGSGGDSGSASASSQATAVAGCAPLTGPNCYSLHEQTEKRFAKWLAEIEQSLQFIEKRMEAESAINNGSSTANDGDDPLYSNVSEMQQMHMNYFEKVKIMQREIEQKRTDHRILMELLDSESESDQTTSSSTTNTTQQQKMVQQQQHQRTDSVGKRTLDPWLNRFRTRVETLNTRWNSIRLRVLTLRSRLESSSIYSNNSLTTTVQRPLTTQSNSASLYSMTNGYGMTGIGRPPSAMEIDVNSMAATMAFSSAASERATQLLLSLRELVEWIIKRQTEFESQQIAQQQAQLQHQARTNPNVPLDVANVLNQKSSLMQLRVQLADKRPIIDSSLIACHNLLRRLALKRAQDVQQAARMSASASIASSIGGNSTNQPTPSGDYDPIRMNQIRAVKRTELAELENSLTREMQRLLDIWNSLQVDVEMRIQRLDDAHLRLTDLQRAMEDLGAKLHEAEYAKSQWIPISEIPYDQIPQQKALLKNYSQLYVSTIARDAVHVNELSARLTGRNVPLSHANLKSLEEVTTRARLLHVATDERARELEQAIHDHGNAQQHFLTEAVEAPWERAVTANKLPCYINRTTESVHIVSPKYTEIMASLIEFNRVRYAAYRTAMKLRSLQSKFGLDHVTLEILAEAFEQHGLGPNAIQKKTVKSVESQPQPQQSQQTSDGNSATNNGGTNLTEDINEDLPYELRLIAVPDIVSCLKMIFEMVASTQAAALARSNDPNGTNGKKSKKNKSKEKDAIFTSATMTTLNDNDMANNGQQQQQTINVPLCVDLCLNWVLALYDAPSRSGYIRQFSFQVAMILLSKISLEQKYLYLFNLIGNDNGRADERRLGLLIYDCLRLPKLLGEVAAFGGTNIEPSIRSCLEMAGQPLDGGAGVASVCAQDVLNWVRAEPQSLVWLLVLHRLRLAERSRHPAKCNLCRCYPIVGFRYRCLKCFNFDLCQECFLCDMATKKHKSSHPIQEYCVATTSGEDMKDFTKILRNKFKSGRYFKRHQALGYLPVQSLHEGDRIEESASQYVQTMPGSYSHNPSANTTPVHTLPYPLTSRAASPGALTQRDLDFVLDTNGARFGTMPTNQPMVYGRNIGPSVSTIGIRQQQQQQQAFIEQHHQPNSSPYSVRQVIGPFDRRLPQYHSTPVSPINRNRSIDDEVHSRLGQYANKLAEVEMINRGGIVRSHSQRNRGTKFDSLPSGAGNGNIYPIGGGGGRSRTLPLNEHHQSHSISGSLNNHYDMVVQSPTDMLSKIAADQRSELEQIIQRLEEENKMLVTEYNQLKDEPTTTKTTTTTTKITNTTAKKKIEKFSSDETDESRVKSDDSTELSSPLYENVKNSLERRQRERINNEQQQQQQQQQKNRSINGDGNDQTKIFQESALNGEIPPHLLEEVRRLRENKSRMETRKDEMERCNLLLESQLSQFKQYINNSGALDPKTKARLAQSIVDMERMLDSGTDCSTPASPTNKSSTIMGHDWRPTKNGTDSSDSNTRSTNSSQRTSTTIQSALLNTAAGRVNNAMEHLVDAITDSGDGQQQSQQQQQQLNRFNGSK